MVLITSPAPHEYVTLVINFATKLPQDLRVLINVFLLHMDRPGGCTRPFKMPCCTLSCVAHQGGLHDPLRPWPDNDAELKLGQKDQHSWKNVQRPLCKSQ